jgi:hypothetical protein
MTLPLFDQPLARHTDPDSSRQAAAELVKSGRHKTQKQRVYEALRRFPNCTSAELAAGSGLDRFMVARRLPDLAEEGRAIQGNEKFCTVTEKNCVTWRAVDTKSANHA